MRWLDIYTITGGTLGIIAFGQSLFRGIATTNKEKWARLVPDIITEDDLHRLSHTQTSFYTISAELPKALLRLNNKLNAKGDAFRFRTLFGDPYRKHLSTLREVTDSMRTRFHSEEWSEFKTDDGGVLLLHLNLGHFERLHGSLGASEQMEMVGKQLRADLERALRALTAIRELATREDVDYLLFWRYSKYR